MPTRRLPPRANLAHLKNQAADLLKGHRAGETAALQVLKEFHPRLRGFTDSQVVVTPLNVSDAQLAIARRYGFASWPRLKQFVDAAQAPTLDLPAHERIADPEFRRAVDLLDRGETQGLRAHLERHRELARRRVSLPGSNYFTNPSLLEFIAENPTRHGTMPPNIAQVARVILDAGAKDDRDAVDTALALVASSRVAQECGRKTELLELLCGYGANPHAALRDAVTENDERAARLLLERGAAMDIVAAAALGDGETLNRLAPMANADDLHRALALAAQHGRIECVRLLLDAGADAVEFTPPPGHSHATPVHQAAGGNHGEIVEMLLAHGARLDVRDLVYHCTPAQWAQHAGFDDLAERLRTIE